jgi:hypothetical protein
MAKEAFWESFEAGLTQFYLTMFVGLMLSFDQVRSQQQHMD